MQEPFWAWRPAAKPYAERGFAPPQASGAMEEEVLSRLLETRMTREDSRVVEACLNELALMVRRVGPGWLVQPFGSIANGFAKHGSDLDATCCYEGCLPEHFPQSFFQEQLVQLLQGHAKFQVIEEIKAARVPILRLKFAQVLDVDLSFQNAEPIPNTKLLAAYAQLHPCVRDLGVMVKLWAKAAGVCGASQGHFSSYSLTLMALYFLQVDPHVDPGLRMPCLPTRCFNSNSGVPQTVPSTWSCPCSSRSELLYRFFNFYTWDFQWGTEVVSVRCGRRAVSSDIAYTQLRGRSIHRLHIEDPFLTSRNLNCALHSQQEALLSSQLTKACGDIQHGVLPVGLQCGGGEPARDLGGQWAQPQVRIVGPAVGLQPGSTGVAEAGRKCGDESSEFDAESTRAGGAEGASSLESDSGSDADCQAGGAAPCKEGRGSGKEPGAPGGAGLRCREPSAVGTGPAPEGLPVTLLQKTWRL